MPITVNFRTSKGIVNTRQFQKNQGVSVYGKVVDVTGIGGPGTHIRMEILDDRNNSIFFKEDITDLWGDYSFWFRTPFEDTRLTIIFTATFSFAGQNKAVIPIGIGNVFASSAPSPARQGGFLDWLTYIPLIVVGVGVVYLIKVLNE